MMPLKRSVRWLALCSGVLAVCNLAFSSAALASMQSKGIKIEDYCSDSVRNSMPNNKQAQTKHDCMRIEKYGDKMLVHGAVAKGDANRIARALKRHPDTSEIHLNSGGGNSAEGMQIGLVLRNSGRVVVVNRNSECASACTVAFLGGKLRRIDNGAKFQVHIYSGFMNGFTSYKNYDFNERRADGFVWTKEIIKNPASFLVSMSKSQHGIYYQSTKANISFDENKYSDVDSIKVARRFAYLRNMIQAIGSNFSEYRMSREAIELSRKLQRKRIESFQHYINNQLEKDVKEIQVGGVSAAHQIAMRIERETALNLIAGLCELNLNKQQRSFIAAEQKPWEVADRLLEYCNVSRFENSTQNNNLLGSRSDAALRMIITMFESRILSVSVLSPETLFNYGFTNVEAM